MASVRGRLAVCSPPSGAQSLLGRCLRAALAPLGRRLSAAWAPLGRRLGVARAQASAQMRAPCHEARCNVGRVLRSAATPQDLLDLAPCLTATSRLSCQAFAGSLAHSIPGSSCMFLRCHGGRHVMPCSTRTVCSGDAHSKDRHKSVHLRRGLWSIANQAARRERCSAALEVLKGSTARVRSVSAPPNGKTLAAERQLTTWG